VEEGKSENIIIIDILIWDEKVDVGESKSKYTKKKDLKFKQLMKILNK